MLTHNINYHTISWVSRDPLPRDSHNQIIFWPLPLWVPLIDWRLWHPPRHRDSINYPLLCNKLPKTQRPKTTHTYYLMVYRSGIQTWFIWILCFGSPTELQSRCQPYLRPHLKSPIGELPASTITWYLVRFVVFSFCTGVLFPWFLWP